jgi:phage shock protein PspC (stress-responsive transcriptional regulator)
MSETIDTTPTLDEAPPRRLVRTNDGRWLAGVCAGLGRYFDVNPLVYRIAFAALALAGGTGLLLYVAAWLVMPSETSEESIAVQALREHRDRPWLLLGIGLLSFGAILALSEARFWPGAGNFWLAALLGGGALVWWRMSHRDGAPDTASPASHADPAAVTATGPPPSPRPPAKPSLFAPALGTILAASGLLGLLAVLGVYDVDLDVALAAGVAIAGVAIAVGAMTQRRVGGLVVLGLILLAGFAAAVVTPVSISSGAGERVERPATIAALDRDYELGLGSLEVDLTALELPPGTTSIHARVGVGELVITVPEDVALRIDAEAGAGEVNVLGEFDDGVNAGRTVTVAGSTPDAPVLAIEADIGFGAIEVRRG